MSVGQADGGERVVVLQAQHFEVPGVALPEARAYVGPPLAVFLCMLGRQEARAVVYCEQVALVQPPLLGDAAYSELGLALGEVGLSQLVYGVEDCEVRGVDGYACQGEDVR